ncbi:MarR family winged helix-turn-helix transcriptional regulator, partial [Streptomyces sp. NPDC001193]
SRRLADPGRGAGHPAGQLLVLRQRRGQGTARGPPYTLTAGALVPAAMVTSGAITNRIDRMEVKGLVERVRDGQDRRSVRVRLTDQGREVAEKVMAEHLQHFASLLAPLDRDTCDTVASALRTLLESHGDTSVG